MKVTYKGDYALKTILDLSLHYDSDIVTSNDIAKRIDAPIKFLEQVLSELKKGGFVLSKRGKVGGYILAKNPAKITVGQVIRFIDGPVEPIACINKGYTNCSDASKCVLKKVWEQVGMAVSAIIDKVNFEDLANEVRKSKQEPVYSI
ncbi:MAG: Rrf2 family transcriptional regulator [Candidatus Omnitrophica bacterium]|nr:Rrf2 family transcriptional regulator [Candidatus Omnitrophota bacterium]